MVKIIFINISILLFLSSCSPRNWWGEKAPAPKIIDLSQPESSNSNAIKQIPRFIDIIDGSETESIAALEYYTKTVNKIWEIIEGQKKNEISIDELKRLITKRIVIFSNDIPKDLDFILSIKSLLGMNHSIRKVTIDWVFQFIKRNREELRVTFQKFNKHLEKINYSDIRSILKISSQIFARIKWEKTPAELTKNINDLLPGLQIKTRLQINLISNFAYEFIGFICPKKQSILISLPSVAKCFDQFVEKFDKGAAWFNYNLNPESNNHDAQEIIKALDYLEVASKEWFSNPSLDGIKTKTILSFLNTIHLASTEHLEESFSIVEKFDGKSDRNIFYPDLVLTIIETFLKGSGELFKVMPIFQQATREKKCQNENTKSWLYCSLSLSDIKKYYKKDQSLEAFKIVQSIVRPAYAKYLKPISPLEITNLLTLKSISLKIVKTFGSEDTGYISSSDINEKNEVLSMLESSITSIESITDYLDSISKPSPEVQSYQTSKNSLLLKNNNPKDSILSGLDLQGISKLVTLVGGDILSIKEGKEKRINARTLSDLFNIFPKGAIHLNSDSVTAIIHLVDSFSYYRDFILNTANFNVDVIYDLKTKKRFIKNTSFFKNLPKIIEKLFPKTYQSCSQFDWNSTCQLSFEQIFIDMNTEIPGYIIETDLDVLILIATGIEGIVDTCDFDSSNRLGWTLFNGKDELDCTFSKISNITQRLLESGIVESDAKLTINKVLSFIDSNSVTRVLGKSLLVTGSKRKLIGLLPKYLFSRYASIGSIYSLLAEIVSPNKSKKLQKLRDKKKRQERDLKKRQKFQEGLDKYKNKQKERLKRQEEKKKQKDEKNRRKKIIKKGAVLS